MVKVTATVVFKGAFYNSSFMTVSTHCSIANTNIYKELSVVVFYSFLTVQKAGFSGLRSQQIYANL